MTVTAWCKEKGISQHTYYSRLNTVRKELLKRADFPLQQIVPLSVSQSVTCATATVQTQCIAGGAEPEKAEPAVPQKMIVSKDGIEVEMPADISEGLLLTLLRGLKDLTADNIYIVCGNTDMRKSIDGLAALVQQQFLRIRLLPRSPL